MMVVMELSLWGLINGRVWLSVAVQHVLWLDIIRLEPLHPQPPDAAYIFWCV